jgi:putative phage-type endonuclease
MTEDFHQQQRLTGLGGGDAAPAIGISPWRTPYDLWLEKTGQGEPVATTEPMLWGTLLEQPIATEYSRRTGRTVESMPMLRHPTHEWMIAHIDRRIVGEKRILEVKTSRDGRGWGEPGTDEIPIYYNAQVQHYCVVSGAEICDVAVLIGGSDFRIYEVHADPVIARELVAQEYEFWQRVEQRAPPEPTNLHDAVRRWGHLLIERAVEAAADELQAIETLRRLREQRATLQAAEVEAKLTLMTALGDKGDALVDANGTLLATWKMDKGRKGYAVESREPARRFLLKG